MIYKIYINLLIFIVVYYPSLSYACPSYSYQTTSSISSPKDTPRIIPRTEWGGKPPTYRQIIDGRLPFVIIHHSAYPPACYNPNDCRAAMRWMQDYHQLIQGWNDIGYSYAIGGDGNIYEGRGFNVVGAHAPGYNDKSVGICLIGDWTNLIPPSIMIDKVNELISYGIRMGHLSENYQLIGHRQVKASTTVCPGDALFREIQKWKHFTGL